MQSFHTDWENEQYTLCKAFISSSSTFLTTPKPVIGITLLIFTIDLGALVLDVITVAIMDGKINMSIGEHEC